VCQESQAEVALAESLEEFRDARHAAENTGVVDRWPVGGVSLLLIVIRGTMGHLTRHREPTYECRWFAERVWSTVTGSGDMVAAGPLRETERDRQQAMCRQTEVLTLRAGETFVGGD
jgi:hypothetical protein